MKALFVGWDLVCEGGVAIRSSVIPMHSPGARF